MRFGLTGARPYTLEEVGRAFNVTRERIRQIENHTLKKLESLPDAQRSAGADRASTHAQTKRESLADTRAGERHGTDADDPGVSFPGRSRGRRASRKEKTRLTAIAAGLATPIAFL